MIVTIELPDMLAEKLRERALIEHGELTRVILTTLETLVAQPLGNEASVPAESATDFARRYITQNRELFEALARR